MEIKTIIEEVSWKKTAVAIGKFEGLHLGHQKLIRKIVEKQQVGFVPVAFTFAVSPRIYFGQDQGMLFTKEERRRVFESWNLACLMECPFTKELASMEAETFVEDILLDKLHTGYLAVGRDFCFGRERRGNTRLLQNYASQGLFQLEILDKKCEGTREISSTRIREQLKNGQLSDVNRMLGFSFFIEGMVTEGNRLGRTWGIPTANLCVKESKLLPPNGVYFSRVKWKGNYYISITNLGNKPTIGKGYAKGAETYLYDFDGDLYGETICVELLSFHRAEQRFDSLEDLVGRLRLDLEEGRKYFIKYNKDH
ncbi:MAG: riboflavin biosynthesis protein RibF [Lachnospiraceae bacterium]|nr:riboflavin biosynthesis protein RibF [Lachnospiraceae bacterium]